MLTTIVRNATIFCGDGTIPYTTDVGIYHDRIVLIESLSERDAHAIVDGTGLSLAPGFIDVHAHTDERWLADSRALSKIAQGVTTEIGGNCGRSAAPLYGSARTKKALDAKKYGIEIEWQTFDEFFSLVEHAPTTLNVASLVGLGTTRAATIGDEERRLDADELAREMGFVREAIEHGAIGISSGLMYEPSRYADIDELVALSVTARQAGAPRYASHLRSESDALVEAVDEALTIGERADVTVQCSHHKAAGHRNWGKVSQSLARIDRARERGLNAYVDLYPYVASWTDLASILPEDIRSGGRRATLARLRDPETATAILLALNLARNPERGGESWHDILVTDVGSEQNAAIIGYRIDEIATAWRVSPASAALTLLIEEELDVSCAFFTMSEDDVATVMSAGFACIGSDASARALTGPTARGLPHPRAFGCFPRVFGRFVRARPTISREEAIRRMTSLPASIFGLRDRGTIAIGGFADLVLFDPDRIVDRATYGNPTVLPEGIASVFVNGRCVFRDGAVTHERPGRVLRGGG